MCTLISCECHHWFFFRYILLRLSLNCKKQSLAAHSQAAAVAQIRAQQITSTGHHKHLWVMVTSSSLCWSPSSQFRLHCSPAVSGRPWGSAMRSGQLRGLILWAASAITHISATARLPEVCWRYLENHTAWRFSYQLSMNGHPGSTLKPRITFSNKFRTGRWQGDRTGAAAVF